MSSHPCEPICEALAESALAVRFEARLDPEISRAAQRLASTLRQAGLPGLTECTASYAEVVLRFDPQQWQHSDGTDPHAALGQAIQPFLASLQTRQQDAVGRLHELPVVYGGQTGADLDEVASRCRLSISELIERHTAPEYQVAMLGFAPGFAYLLGLDPELQVPRRDTPRTRVPAGSVGIGGAQTGIYPAQLPGGWQLLGRTSARLFDPDNEQQPTLLQPGDRVRFVPVAEANFTGDVGEGA